MAITKALSVQRNTCVKMADIVVGSASTDRHQLDDVNVYVNDSHRALMTLLTTRGFDFYLAETSLASLPTSRADTNEQYSVVDWPDDSTFIKRVDVYSSDRWHELDRRDWTQLRSESRSRSDGATRPLVWAPKSQGSVSGTDFTSGKIALAPFSSNGTYKITYQPEWSDITTDTHLFLYPDEICAQWVVWDFVAKVAIRDRDGKKRRDMALLERTHAEELIGSFVPKIVQSGPLTVTRSPGYRR